MPSDLVVVGPAQMRIMLDSMASLLAVDRIEALRVVSMAVPTPISDLFFPPKVKIPLPKIVRLDFEPLALDTTGPGYRNLFEGTSIRLGPFNLVSEEAAATIATLESMNRIE